MSLSALSSPVNGIEAVLGETGSSAYLVERERGGGGGGERGRKRVGGKREKACLHEINISFTDWKHNFNFDCIIMSTSSYFICMTYFFISIISYDTHTHILSPLCCNETVSKQFLSVLSVLHP